MNRFDLNFDESAGVSSARRYFTLEQANRALVLVKRIVADMVGHYHRLLELQEVLDAGGGSSSGQIESLREELVCTAQGIQCFADELDAVGVELKDWALGVVDFPCLAAGREIYLCWRYGESRVEHWHELDAGSAGRRPIATLPAKEPSVVQHV